MAKLKLHAISYLAAPANIIVNIAVANASCRRYGD